MIHSLATRKLHPYKSSPCPPSSVHTNRALSIFYSRSKRTFFTPNSPYGLDLPSDIPGPFHAPSPSSDSLNHPPNRDFSTSSSALSHIPTRRSSPRLRIRSTQHSRNAWTVSRHRQLPTSELPAQRAVLPVAPSLLPSLVSFHPS